MNKEFEELAQEAIKINNVWRDIASIAGGHGAMMYAYDKFLKQEQQQMNQEQEEQARGTMDEPKFYLAGVRACRLAEIVLNSKPNKNERRLALDVLRDFGIVFDASHLPGTEEEAKADAPAPAAQQEV